MRMYKHLTFSPQKEHRSQSLTDMHRKRRKVQLFKEELVNRNFLS